jgi:PAS domain S-box-containing protein
MKCVVLNTSASEHSELVQILQSIGTPILVKEVRTRDAFLDALAAESPDVVINFCLFPELDGMAALQLLQETKVKSPFIIVGEKRTAAAEECLAAGATAFFAKGEEEQLAEFIRNLNGGGAARAQKPKPDLRYKVALWIEPLTLRLKIEKLLLKLGEVQLVPAYDSAHTADLLLLSLNEFTGTPPSFWETKPWLLLTDENHELEAIEQVRRGAVGYVLLEQLSESRLQIALYQAFRQIKQHSTLKEQEKNIANLQRALEDVQGQMQELEAALHSERQLSEMLKKELDEQELSLAELAKENEDVRRALEDVQGQMQELEAALHSERQLSEMLKKELDEQELSLAELAKENEDVRRALEDVQGQMQELEAALHSERQLSEMLKKELDEQGLLLTELTKENQERQFWHEVLQHREQRFRKMIEHSSDMIVLVDAEGKILYESSAALRIIGYTSEELVGKSAFDLVCPDEREQVREFFEKQVHIPGISPLQRMRMQHKDGHWIYVEAIYNNLLHDETICAMIVNAHDVTEYVRIQQELQKAKEDFEARVIERTRDLIELSRRLQEEIQAHRRTEEALKQSEDYFWKIFRYNPLPIVLCDANTGRTLNVNQAFEALSGIGYEDALGKQIEELGFNLSTEHLCMHITRKCEGSESRPVSLEVDLHTKSSGVKSLVVTLQYVELGREQCGLIIMQDVTERIHAEKSLAKSLSEKDVLLKEIHHRVKNNLQVISSLLYLQSLKLQDEQAKRIFRESQNRVKAMALIHEQLYQTKDFMRVDFAEYLQTLASMIAESYNEPPSIIDVQIDSEKLDLSIDAAIPAGLIVSELVTNSLKYAFPETAESAEKNKEIAILARKTSDNDIMLTVCDNGIGLNMERPLESPKTLGLRLVKMLTEQLRGSIEVLPQKGAAFCIRFKDEAHQ